MLLVADILANEEVGLLNSRNPVGSKKLQKGICC